VETAFGVEDIDRLLANASKSYNSRPAGWNSGCLVISLGKYMKISGTHVYDTTIFHPKKLTNDVYDFWFTLW
jgi:hypothetical protein